MRLHIMCSVMSYQVRDSHGKSQDRRHDSHRPLKAVVDIIWVT